MACSITKELISLELLEKIAPVIRVAAHPTRLRILDFLNHNAEPQSVMKIVEACQQPQAIVSQHLRILKDQGILKCERNGTTMLYSIANPNILFLLECIGAHHS